MSFQSFLSRRLCEQEGWLLAPSHHIMPRAVLSCGCLVKKMGSLLDLAPHRRGNNQQMIFHDETDRTDFLTRLGQEVL